MKVLLANEGALSDYEVLQVVQERQTQRLHTSGKAYADRNWIDHKIVKFLTHHQQRSSQLTPERIQHFLQAIETQAFDLTPGEKMQLINHCPTELVDIHLLIEDCADRFTDDQIDQLMALVGEFLVVDPPAADPAPIKDEKEE